MRIFGYEVSFSKAPVPVTSLPASMTNGGWFNVIREPFTGAWQRNMELRQQTILAFHAVYACIKLISSDISKCRLRLVEMDSNGIWREVDRASPYWPVLRKPNRYSNRIKFIENWVISKLIHGNTYVLKERDARKIVVAMYVLDATRTRAVVAPDGSVYYRLYTDNLIGIEEGEISVPASEIIHDVMVPLYHPLCGVSPLTACGIAAAQGLIIQGASSEFFANGTRPGGVLTAPGMISKDNADRIKDYWEQNYGGNNFGKVAVLGDGLKYEAMSVNAVDSQLIEQLKWTAEVVATAFNVPAYKINAGPMPAHNNIEALDQQYYSQCLQHLFECIELGLDHGLGLTEVPDRIYGTEFDTDDLLRMDTATMVEAEAKAVGAGIKKPNEARHRMNLGPVPGGDTPYMQKQNYSLAALNKRDTQANPFDEGPKTPITPPDPEDAADDTPADAADEPAKGIDIEMLPMLASMSLRRRLGLIEW
jgi:HK97 family phage portal protein